MAQHISDKIEKEQVALDHLGISVTVIMPYDFLIGVVLTNHLCKVEYNEHYKCSPRIFYIVEVIVFHMMNTLENRFIILIGLLLH